MLKKIFTLILLLLVALPVEAQVKTKFQTWGLSAEMSNYLVSNGIYASGSPTFATVTATTVTASGTVSAEQLTSTDDLTVTDAISAASLGVSSAVGVNDGTVNFTMNLTGNDTVLGTTTNHPLNIYTSAVNYWDFTAGGDLAAVASGSTFQIEDDTAASTCAGQTAANGTTAVTISTTCINTGDYIFISRNGQAGTLGNCWTTNIVNGTSFDLDCDSAETSTYNWWIINQL